MPEIKPVEPDPDNAGVGNNRTSGSEQKVRKTKICNNVTVFVPMFMGKTKNPVCVKNFRSVL